MKKFNLLVETVISDGVEEFKNKELEDIAWHAKEFDITHKELVEILKDKCENESISTEEDVKNTMYNFCKSKILKMIENDEDFSEANLTDDEAFAAGFFEVI